MSANFNALTIQVLSDDEIAALRFHFETSKRGRSGRLYLKQPITRDDLELMPCLSS